MADVLSVRIESPALSSDAVKLFELGGRESISQLFGFDVHVVTTDPAGLDEEAVLANPAVLVFTRGDAEVRRIGGMIASVRDRMESETVHAAYTLSFVPRAYRMTLVTTSEIFMDLSVPDVVKKKLERAGLVAGDDFDLRLGSYPPREFVVQYQETDLAFVSRLAEHLGIYFFFEQSGDKDVIVFADKNSASKPIAGDAHVAFRARGERTGVHAISALTKTVPGRYVVKDYNYRTPGVPLLAEASQVDGGGYIVEYGAHFKTPDEGAKIAGVRAEELKASRKVFTGKSDAQVLAAGATFTLEGHARGDAPLLLVEVTHRAQQGVLAMGKTGEHKYENEFQAIPEKTQYRPPRVTPKPKVPGVITGTIDAAAKGPYAELDGDGRYRVRFMFDTGDAADGKASRLCRMAQPHAGGGYGMHFPLRSGVEVILAFIEGDPDRPIIAGTVPNPATPGPVTSGNAPRNIIRTGGGNEINLDDTGGSERIKLSTPFGSTIFQLGSPNAPEEGAALTTTKSWTTVAENGTAAMTSVSTLIADTLSAFSSADIVQFAGPGKLATAIESWAKVASDAAGAVKAIDSFYPKWKAEAASRAAVRAKDTAKDLAAAQAQKQAADQAKVAADKARDDARARLAAAQAAHPKEPTHPEVVNAMVASNTAAIAAGAADAAATQATADLVTATKVDASAQEASTDANDEANDAANGPSAWVAAGAGAVKAAVDEGVALLGAKGLLSSIVKAFKGVSDASAKVEANAMVTSANAVLNKGPQGGVVPPIVTPCFIGAALDTAALTGTATAFVGGGVAATVYSAGQASLLGRASAAVKSANTVVYGQFLTDVMGGIELNVVSGDKLLVQSKGPATFTFKNTLTETVTDLTKVETGGVEYTSKKHAKLTVDEGPTTVTATKGDMTVTVTDGGFKLDAASAKSILELDKDKSRLAHQDWVFIAKPDGVAIGDGSSGCMAKDGEVRLMTKEGDLKLDSDLTLKVSAVKFNVDGQVKIDGSKICFG